MDSKRKSARSGHLFGERFKAFLVDEKRRDQALVEMTRGG
jgi:hypothetical protein